MAPRSRAGLQMPASPTCSRPSLSWGKKVGSIVNNFTKMEEVMWIKAFLIVAALFALALVAPQAADQPASPAHFGAKLTSQTQPSNAGHGDFCSVNTSH